LRSRVCGWLCAAAVVTAAGCAGRTSRAAAPGPTPAADLGLQILRTACTSCHDLGGVNRLAGYFSRSDWDDLVRSMIANGARVSDEHLPVLVDYLTETYGKR
jgi:cytochrome c5